MLQSNSDLPVSDLAHTAHYNCLDCLVTSRLNERLQSEGGLTVSLFDQALLGPALTCTLRGLRVDYGKMEEARDSVVVRIKEVRQQFQEAAGGEWKWGRGAKPSNVQLGKLLYDRFKVRARLTENDTYSVAADKLVDILEDPKTPEVAIPAIEAAIELSKLEEDRKSLSNPMSPDGRLHCSFLVAAQVSGRWSARKDSFGRGIALYGASDTVRRIVIADPGYIIVSMDQCQAESKLMSYLIGSEWWQESHERGNVHLDVGKILFPEHAAIITKKWAKDTDYPGRPGKSYYGMMKAMAHGLDYGQSYKGLARQLKIKEADAALARTRYFAQIPELPEYHRWVADEIKTKRRLVSPMGRVRQFLDRVWENSVIREAIAQNPQSGVSDLTKSFLYRLWKRLDPHDLQVLFEHHDSVVFQVRESQLDEVMPKAIALSRISLPIGDKEMRVKWECKIGPSWFDLRDVPEGRMRSWGWEG